jgi:methanethiol S-methyltransferase
MSRGDAISKVGRIVGWVFGIGTQILFLFTVVGLFRFLRFGSQNPLEAWWLVDLLLAIGFALPHSLLLAPPVQSHIKRYVPAGLLGCIHCTVTCVSLLILFHFWGRSDLYLWKATGSVEIVVLGLFYASWIALFYSLWLTGLGYQTGLTPWWYWATKQKPPPRVFVTKGAFRFMRHPVYMSFLGLIWFTPEMTLDHAILTTVWTVYIYAGSYFKDRRLIRFIGEPYLAYAAKVVGLPLIGFGSLRRIPPRTSKVSAQIAGDLMVTRLPQT